MKYYFLLIIAFVIINSACDNSTDNEPIKSGVYLWL